MTVFDSTCASCHTLAAAGSTGTVGPNLDQLKPSDSVVVKQVTNGGGGMPAFGSSLSKSQIQSVALFVSSVAGKPVKGKVKKSRRRRAVIARRPRPPRPRAAPPAMRAPAYPQGEDDGAQRQLDARPLSVGTRRADMRQPPGSSVAAGAARGERWLRADLRDVVRVKPRGDGSAVVPPAELEAGLRRWSGRLSRSRALVVARRWLLLGLIVALIPAIVILAVGGSRPWWLFAVVLVGPLAGLVAVARRPSAARTAQVLDRRLGLADRLTTALELRSAPVAPTGLGGLVVDEASSALGQSLGNERAVARRSPRELAWLLAAVVALAVLIAVPRSGSSTTSSTRAAAGPGLAAGGGAAGASATRSGAAASGRTTIPSSTPLPRPASPNQLFKTGSGHYDPNANPYGKNPYGGGKYQGGNFKIKQQHDAPTGAAPGLALATPGGANTPPGPAAGAAGGSSGNQPVSAAGAGQSGVKASAGQPNPGGLAPTGGAGGGAGGAASHGGAGASGGAGSPGASAGAHGTQSGTQSGSGGQSGGETAGGVRAGQTHGVGLVPALGGSGKGLPLQGSLAGSRASRSGSHGAISGKANGGGGFARGVQASSGAAGGGGVNLPVLAPTFNSSSQPESGLLERYFGAANRLGFKAW